GAAVLLEANLKQEILTEYVMPPISMQILAENAFKHNEFSIQEPLEIRISCNNNQVLFYNKKRKKTGLKSSSKLGLHNLQERYKLTTGQVIEIIEKEDSFTVCLPLLRID